MPFPGRLCPPRFSRFAGLIVLGHRKVPDFRQASHGFGGSWSRWPTRPVGITSLRGAQATKQSRSSRFNWIASLRLAMTVSAPAFNVRLAGASNSGGETIGPNSKWFGPLLPCHPRTANALVDVCERQTTRLRSDEIASSLLRFLSGVGPLHVWSAIGQLFARFDELSVFGLPQEDGLVIDLFHGHHFRAYRFIGQVIGRI